MKTTFLFFALVTFLVSWADPVEARLSRYVMDLNPNFFVAKTCNGANGKTATSSIVVNLRGDRSSETSATQLSIDMVVCWKVYGVGVDSLSIKAFPAKQIFTTDVGVDQTIVLQPDDLERMKLFIKADLKPEVLVKHTITMQGDKFTLVLSNAQDKVVGKLSIYLSAESFMPMATPPFNTAWSVLKDSWPIVGFEGSYHTIQSLGATTVRVGGWDN